MFDGKGESKIPDYTWHHHQDTGRMQLINEGLHHDTYHIGWRAMSKGK
ncbi:HNH endonuclease [Neisseria gonorrhoeae]|nr:HNH endonuclease [Neisseria gonorrhoeae]